MKTTQMMDLSKKRDTMDTTSRSPLTLTALGVLRIEPYARGAAESGERARRCSGGV